LLSYCQHCLIAGVVDTGEPFFSSGVDTAEKLFTGVNDTAVKIFAGVIDTCDKTVLKISACLGLKMKLKQKFNL
jgi:hypothetical protein